MALTAQQKAAARERREALVEARDSGATEVRYRDRTVRYRSLDEIESLVQQIDREIAGKPRKRRPRTYGVYTRKGV
tara:strand:- start:1954 stop:2181 length:228 start_codon:yes stop_codon:yes gene_type:complete